MAAAAAVLSASACDNSVSLAPCQHDLHCKLDRVCDPVTRSCVFPAGSPYLQGSNGVGAGSAVGGGGAAAPGSGGSSSSSASGGAAASGGTGGAGAQGGDGGTGGMPECTTASECPGTDSDCHFRTCIGEMCGFGDAPMGALCDDMGGSECDGSGNCVFVDEWTTLPAGSRPSARYGHTAVWTGTVMIVWGGRSGGTTFGDGAYYNPTTNMWTTMSNMGAPADRYLHEAVWTGTRMVVWGGFSLTSGTYLNTGAVYDPGTNTWTQTMTTTGAPAGRVEHSMAYWNGRAIVWGGRVGAPPAFGDGKRYVIAGNSWEAMSTTNDPSPRFAHVGVRAGSYMVVWSGADFFDWFNDGKIYDPAANTWETMTNAGAPGIRQDAAAVYDGELMLVWGGWDGGNYYANGGTFDPNLVVGGFWSGMPGAGPPAARAKHIGLWTGDSHGFFVWGGCGGVSCGTVYGDGGLWNLGVWQPIAASPTISARYDHTGVWTGSEVIIFGGRNAAGTALGDGARRALP